jgi:hypothetical protein
VEHTDTLEASNMFRWRNVDPVETNLIYLIFHCNQSNTPIYLSKIISCPNSTPSRLSQAIDSLLSMQIITPHPQLISNHYETCFLLRQNYIDYISTKNAIPATSTLTYATL